MEKGLNSVSWKIFCQAVEAYKLGYNAIDSKKQHISVQATVNVTPGEFIIS